MNYCDKFGMKKNAAFVSIGFLLKIVLSLFSFYITAKKLSVENFGELMYIISMTAIAGILPNYGFNQYILSVEENCKNINKTINGVFSAKIILSVCMFFLCLGVGFLFNDINMKFGFLLIYFSVVIEGFVEILSSVFKTHSKYKIDAQLSIYSSIVYCVGLCSVVYFTENILYISSIYFITRVVALILFYRETKILIGEFVFSCNNGIFYIKNMYKYALDTGINSIYGQIDSVVLMSYGGEKVVGNFQSGMRLFLFGTQLASVVAGLFLPAVAKKKYSAEKNTEYILILYCLIIGMIGFISFKFGRYFISNYLYNEKYEELVNLLPIFGLLFQVRFASAGFGIILAAKEHQGNKLVSSVLHWIAVLFACSLILSNDGGYSWIYALIFGGLIQLFYYIYVCHKYRLVDKYKSYMTCVLFLLTASIVCFD